MFPHLNSWKPVHGKGTNAYMSYGYLHNIKTCWINRFCMSFSYFWNCKQNNKIWHLKREFCEVRTKCKGSQAQGKLQGQRVAKVAGGFKDVRTFFYGMLSWAQQANDAKSVVKNSKINLKMFVIFKNTWSTVELQVFMEMTFKFGCFFLYSKTGYIGSKSLLAF